MLHIDSTLLLAKLTQFARTIISKQPCLASALIWYIWWLFLPQVLVFHLAIAGRPAIYKRRVGSNYQIGIGSLAMYHNTLTPIKLALSPIKFAQLKLV